MNDRLTCILCPVGCGLDVSRVGDHLEVRGNECDKGLDFAADEVLHPKRNLATSIPAMGTSACMISVRLTAGVPRDMIFPILAEIAKLRPALPVKRGQVLIANVMGTGADVIATRTVES
jgi:CxxC motif-containing protein